MAITNMISTTAPDGTIYTFVVDGTQVKVKDNKYRTAYWNVVVIPSATAPISAMLHESGVVEFNYVDANGAIVRKFSEDDGETWA